MSNIHTLLNYLIFSSNIIFDFYILSRQAVA